MALSYPEPLKLDQDLSAFSCGKPALDRWLQSYALRNQAQGFTAVVVVHENMRVIAYYGIAPTSIIPSILPRSIRTGQPPSPVPCLLLGQLAVDTNCAGRGIGDALLTHALARAVKAAELIGGRALMVDAIDDEAASYWRYHGFTPSADEPLKLFRSISQIAKSLAQSRLDNS